MGMSVTFQVADDAADERWLDDVYQDFATLDEIFSPFGPKAQSARSIEETLATLKPASWCGRPSISAAFTSRRPGAVLGLD